MHNFAIMTVFESKADLGEVVQDFFFIEVFAIFFLLLYLISKLTIICVFHHHVQKHVSILEDIFKLDDVRMVKNFKNFCLILRFLSLVDCHRLQIDFLDYPEFLGYFRAHEVSHTARPSP